MKLITFFAACVLTGALEAGAGLQPGDVAVIAYNTDSTDSFAWVALSDIPPETAIHFTNSSVHNGWFRWGDHLGRPVGPGPLTWTYTNLLKAGSVVSWIAGTQKCWSVGTLSGGGMALSASGDQIIVYTGSITSNGLGIAPWWGDPTHAVMLFGLNFANNGWTNLMGGDVNTSFVPPGLSEESHTAVHAGNWDNGYYSGSRRGGREALLRLLATQGNWTSSADFINFECWPAFFWVEKFDGLKIFVE